MARLERWKYIPMLVRAYQEAKTRAETQSHERIQRNSSDPPAPKAGFSPSDQMMVREAGQAQSGRRMAKRGSSASRAGSAPARGAVRPNRTTVRNQKAVQKQAAKKAANHAGNHGANQSKKRANVRAATQTLRPKSRVLQQARASIQDVLQELRSTKQQLSQLQAIQMQLTEVQSQLSQQLDVLKGSIRNSEESQAKKPSGDTEQHTMERTTSDTRSTPPDM